MERRGLESERRTGINRRMELEGAADAEVVRESEAFWGRNSEILGAACCASLRAFWRRRCGSSWVNGRGGGGSRSDLVASSSPVELGYATVEAKVPLLPPFPMLPNNEFG